MFVRIARFEGAEGNWEDRIEAIRKRMDGEEDSSMSEVRDAVSRAMMLVDREGGRGASVVFCESEEDLRRVDDAMNRMTPPGGSGSRSGVEVYEVAIDRQFG